MTETLLRCGDIPPETLKIRSRIGDPQIGYCAIGKKRPHLLFAPGVYGGARPSAVANLRRGTRRNAPGEPASRRGDLELIGKVPRRTWQAVLGDRDSAWELEIAGN